MQQSALASLLARLRKSGSNPGKMVDMKSLLASVQETINSKAAGREVVRAEREDDANGKWNYKVVVRTNGKEWRFEVDPNGKFLKQQSDIKE